MALFEVKYYFIQKRGALKGLELDSAYKLPELTRAMVDAKRIARRKDTTAVIVMDMERHVPIAYWNRAEGWA